MIRHYHTKNSVKNTVNMMDHLAGKDSGQCFDMEMKSKIHFIPIYTPIIGFFPSIFRLFLMYSEDR